MTFPGQTNVTQNPKPQLVSIGYSSQEMIGEGSGFPVCGSAMKGMLVYKLYRALTYGLSPLIHLHLRWRKIRGLEHPHRWRERLGSPSLPRPSGHLLWFHAVSLGEGMAAIPVIRHCNRMRPDLIILMTTTTLSAFEVIKNSLPVCVIYQFSPLDIPSAIDNFLNHWKPNAIIIMENELWPNLIMRASSYGIPLTLLNARVSMRSLKLWSRPVPLLLISLLLSKFSLITPLSNMQAINFQLLQAPPFIINFAGDLKYVVDEHDDVNGNSGRIEDLELQLAHKKVWIASSLHRGEEEVILGIQNVLVQTYPDIIAVIVPRHPQHGQEIAQELYKIGQNVALRSKHEKLMPGTNIYMVDTLGELRFLYRLAPIAVVCGSFIHGLNGHNISEAAAAGCAIVTGYHVGHFAHMVLGMQRLNPLSVWQVSGKVELEVALRELLSRPRVLKARQLAAKQSLHSLSSCIIGNIWNLLNFHVLKKTSYEKR